MDLTAEANKVYHNYILCGNEAGLCSFTEHKKRQQYYFKRKASNDMLILTEFEYNNRTRKSQKHLKEIPCRDRRSKLKEIRSSIHPIKYLPSML